MARFAGVGVVNSALYFILAAIFSGVLNLATVPSSVLAYVLAAGVAYLGHKFVTFGQPNPAMDEMSRFLAATALGLSLAVVIPILLHSFAPMVSFVTVLIVVPLCSFVLMKFFVFRL